MVKETGKAMVCTKIGDPYELWEYPIPEVESNAILVKITMACICGSDIHHYLGEYTKRKLDISKEKPRIMGHEMVGTIYKMGSKVKTDYLGHPLKEGDRIVYSYFVNCGKCWACFSGVAPCPTRHISGTSAEFPHFRGAYGEYYYLRSDRQWVFKVPDELSDESVAPVNCALSTVTYGMHKVSIPLGGKVVVQGAGGLGLAAAVIAKEMGAARVITVDKVVARLEMSKSFGADEVINFNEYPTAETRAERVKELTGGQGVDVAVEVTGNPNAFSEGIEMLAPGGTYLSMGLVTGGFSHIDMERVVHKGLTIIGSATYQVWVIPKVLDMLVRTKNKYPFHRLISHKFNLEDINEGFKQLIEGKVIRAAVVPR